ncbi:MAG: radical SAM protein [archaeon]
MRPIIIPDTYKYIGVFLTMRCNLNCGFCLNNLKNSQDFNRIRFREISGREWVDALNKIESREDVPVTLSGGEPSLHRDFFYILNNIKPELNIDILTNLQWGEFGIKKFISEVNPNRIKRNVPYPSIRVSYHSEQMGNGQKLVENVKALQDAGFSIGIESVMYPHPQIIEAIEQMALKCKNNGISFRPKSFTGKFQGTDDSGNKFSILHGNYSKYRNSILQPTTKECLCKTTELLIGPDAKIYRCHRDLFSEEFPVGTLIHPEFQINDDFRECSKYGDCHPCDVKVKTNYKQELGHTSVKIKDIRN